MSASDAVGRFSAAPSSHMLALRFAAFTQAASGTQKHGDDPHPGTRGLRVWGKVGSALAYLVNRS